MKAEDPLKALIFPAVISPVNPRRIRKMILSHRIRLSPERLLKKTRKQTVNMAPVLRPMKPRLRGR